MSAISVQNLSKYYEVHQKEPGLVGSLKSFVRRKTYPVKAVDDISFSIESGELVGFLGPNGAGKTTTLKVLSGLLYPTGGDVSVLGHTPWERQAAFQRRFALVMGQKNQLWWDLPPMETFLINKEIYEVPEAQFQRDTRRVGANSRTGEGHQRAGAQAFPGRAHEVRVARGSPAPAAGALPG